MDCACTPADQCTCDSSGNASPKSRKRCRRRTSSCCDTFSSTSPSTPSSSSCDSILLTHLPPTVLTQLCIRYLSKQDVLHLRLSSRALAAAVGVHVAESKVTNVRWLCSAGKLQALQAVPGLSAWHVRESPCLLSACENGHLDVVRWLVHRFGFTAEAMRHRNHEVIRMACERGHEDVARWLVDQVQAHGGGVQAVGDETAPDWVCWAFSRACAGGHLAIAQWLHSHFRLSPSDVTFQNGYALRRANMYGHSSVTQWLFTVMQQQTTVKDGAS